MCLALWLCLSKVQTYFMSKIIEEKNQRPQIYEGLAPFSAKPGPGDSDKCPAFQEHLRRAGRLAASHSQANRGQRHRVTRQVIQPVSTARLSRSLTRGSQHGEQRRDGGALPEPCPSRSRGSSVQGMNRGPTHSSAPGSEASHHLHFQQPHPHRDPWSRSTARIHRPPLVSPAEATAWQSITNAHHSAMWADWRPAPAAASTPPLCMQWGQHPGAKPPHWNL